MLKSTILFTIFMFFGFLSLTKAQLSAGFEMPVIIEPKFSNKSFNVRDFGAVADEITVNTKSIGDAIEAARKAGGGTVVFSQGIWVTGPIVLVSNVCLHLEKNVLVAFSKNRDEYL